MEKIMNVENEWEQMAKADMVEGPVEEVTYEEVIEAMNKMKWKSSWSRRGLNSFLCGGGAENLIC